MHTASTGRPFFGWASRMTSCGHKASYVLCNIPHVPCVELALAGYLRYAHQSHVITQQSTASRQIKSQTLGEVYRGTGTAHTLVGMSPRVFLRPPHHNT